MEEVKGLALDDHASRSDRAPRGGRRTQLLFAKSEGAGRARRQVDRTLATLGGGKGGGTRILQGAAGSSSRERLEAMLAAAAARSGSPSVTRSRTWGGVLAAVGADLIPGLDPWVWRNLSLPGLRARLGTDAQGRGQPGLRPWRSRSGWRCAVRIPEDRGEHGSFWGLHWPAGGCSSSQCGESDRDSPTVNTSFAASPSGPGAPADWAFPPATAWSRSAAPRCWPGSFGAPRRWPMRSRPGAPSPASWRAPTLPAMRWAGHSSDGPSACCSGAGLAPSPLRTAGHDAEALLDRFSGGHGLRGGRSPARPEDLRGPRLTQALPRPRWRWCGTTASRSISAPIRKEP